MKFISRFSNQLSLNQTLVNTYPNSAAAAAPLISGSVCVWFHLALLLLKYTFFYLNINYNIEMKIA